MSDDEERPARRLVYVPLEGGGALVDPDAPPREEPVIIGGSVQEYPWGQLPPKGYRRRRKRQR